MFGISDYGYHLVFLEVNTVQIKLFHIFFC